MPKYKLEMKLDSEHSAKVMQNIFQETAEDWDMRVIAMKLTRTRRRGRPTTNNKRLDLWLEKRTTPFKCITLADFLGLSNSATWRKLEGLVKAGVYEKVRLEDGSVEYRRPDNPVAAE